MKLTRREKTLIAVLVVLVVIFAGWKFLLNPAMAEKQRLESSIESLTFQKNQVNEIVSEAEVIRNDLENAYLEMNAEAFFYHNLKTAGVDRLLSAYAKENAVTISEMVIAYPEIVGLDGYIPNIAPLFSSFREQRIKFDKQAAQDYIDEADGLPTGESETVAITIPLYRCNLMVRGKTADVVAMVDAINHSGRSIYVRSFGDRTIQNIESGIFEDMIYVDIYFLED